MSIFNLNKDMTFSFFDELKIVQRTPIFQTKSIYGTSALRDIVTGTVNQSGGTYSLENQGNGDVTVLDTAERLPYAPGFVSEMGEGFLIPEYPTGETTVDLGLFGNDDGWFYRFTADGMFRVVLRDSIEDVQKIGYWTDDNTKIAIIADANNTKIDIANGYIYQIQYSWYAFGPAEYSFQLRKPDSYNGKWLKQSATFTPSGSTSVTDPQQPVRARVTTGAGDPPFTVFVGGRQGSILGPYDPIFRETTVEHTVVGVTDAAWFPAITVRRKSITPYALTQLLEFYARASGDLRVAYELNTDVTGVSWVGIPDYDQTETLLECGLSPSVTFGTGTLLKKLPKDGGTRSDPGGSTTAAERLPLIEQQAFTIYLRRFTGESAAIDVNVFATFREDY